jgi:hypothetical protein
VVLCIVTSEISGYAVKRSGAQVQNRRARGSRTSKLTAPQIIVRSVAYALPTRLHVTLSAKDIPWQQSFSSVNKTSNFYWIQVRTADSAVANAKEPLSGRAKGPVPPRRVMGRRNDQVL